MHRIITATAALLLLQPLVGYSADLDIPEIGVYLTNLPAGSTKSTLSESLDSSAIAVHVGKVALFILRLDDPVPAGTSVTDSAYLKALRENFGDKLDPKADGRATTVSGRAAWTEYRGVISPLVTVVTGGRASTLSQVATYTCVTYVIANEHVYRLSANTTAPYDAHAPNDKPPDFVSALKAMFDLTFQPVVRPPVTPGEPAPANIRESSRRRSICTQPLRGAWAKRG
jgi:hypothetical protein